MIWHSCGIVIAQKHTITDANTLQTLKNTEISFNGDVIINYVYLR